MARVLLIGPGAIGCAVAGGLISGGHEVAMVARTPFAELHVEHPEGEVRSPAWCVGEPDESLQPDVVVLAVKAHQTEACRDWLAAGTGAGVPVYVLQNGIEQRETVRPFVSEGSWISPTVVNLPADRRAPGHVVIRGRSGLTVPAPPSGDDPLARLLDGSYVRVKVVEDWATPAWIKLMLNAAMGGVGALTLRDNRVFGDPEAASLATALMEEVAAVARADGATIPADLPGQMVERVQAAAHGHASSIVVDRRNGEPTEWQTRNAVIGRIGRRHGIETPLNDLITTLLRLGEPG